MSVDERQHIARLLVSCPDRHGIVAAVSGLFSEHDERIVPARAVGRHLDDRVLVHENRTVVF
jgi:formyltetrahydrofolate hydrolase